jgi:hypothetical protein
MVSVASSATEQEKEMAGVAAQGWKGELNLRSVLGLAWVERGDMCAGGGRKGLGPCAPSRGKLGNSVGQQAGAGGGRCGSWWGFLGKWACSLAEIEDSPARFNADGLMKARLARGMATASSQLAVAGEACQFQLDPAIRDLSAHRFPPTPATNTSSNAGRTVSGSGKQHSSSSSATLPRLCQVHGPLEKYVAREQRCRDAEQAGLLAP